MSHWTAHPLLQTMAPAKIALLERALDKADGKSGRALLPVLLSILTEAQKQKIHFSTEETDVILQIVKEGKSVTEQQQIDQTFHKILAVMNGLSPLPPTTH